MLYGAKLLQFAGFPTAEVLGPDASAGEMTPARERSSISSRSTGRDS